MTTKTSLPRVLVFQHAPFCPLGTLGECMAKDGIAPVIVELHNGDGIPSLDAFDALIVLGGPMDVWETDAHPWMLPEKVAIQHWVGRFDRPMLGICLGHQLLADALGGEVSRSKKPEAGLGTIDLTEAGKTHALLQGFGNSKRAINFHGCEVTGLPSGGQCLASTSDCPISAFSVGSAAFGIQYHAEANDVIFEEWTDLDAGGALVRSLYGEDGVKAARNRVAHAMPELRNNAERLYRNFMSIVLHALPHSASPAPQP